MIELDWAKCGTEANGRAHYRRGEKPCQACRRAVAEARRERKARRRELPAGDPRHGRYSAYEYWLCRCEACKEAAREYRRELQRRRRSA